MLYPKFTQRYLAAIVFTLILVLGISTLFLVYSLYLRRSPLLVESLKSIESVIPNEKLKENRIFNTKFLGQSDRVNKPPNENAINYKKESEDNMHTENTTNWALKKNGTDFDDSNYSDTIYIDDFDRNRTNFVKIEKPAFESKTAGIVPVQYSKFKVLNNAHMRKFERLPKQQFNLDALYDRNQDSSENFDIAEDDIDADDVDDSDDNSSIYGSGSGDFSDKLFDYDISTVTYFKKDWANHDHRLRYNFHRHMENQHSNRNYNKTKKPKSHKNSERGKKWRTKKPFKSGTRSPENNRFVEDIDGNSLKKEKRRFATRLKGAMSSASPNIKSQQPSVENERRNLNRKNKYSRRPKTQTIMTPTTIESTTTTSIMAKKLGNAVDRSNPALRYTERNNELRISEKTDSLLDKPAARNSQMIPTTWVEARTRRILGNVRKSEERSRQLLLCEEAGVGELCRMLFKGHSLK